MSAERTPRAPSRRSVFVAVALMVPFGAGGCGHDDGPVDPLELLPSNHAEVERWNAWRQRDDDTPDLRGADLRGFSWAATNLSEVDLREADLRAAKLRGAVLDGAALKGAKLEGADLREASLQHADLRWADLQTVDVRGADFTGADLRAADLTLVDLTGTDLGQADLRGALLHGANLREAELSDTDLRGAVADTSTQWPPSFRYYRAQVRVERSARTPARNHRSPPKTAPGKGRAKRGEVVIPERRTDGPPAL